MDIKEKITSLYAEYDSLENEQIALKLRMDELSEEMNEVFTSGLSERLKALVEAEHKLFLACGSSIGHYILAKEAHKKANQEVEDFKNYFR